MRREITWLSSDVLERDGWLSCTEICEWLKLQILREDEGLILQAGDKKKLAVASLNILKEGCHSR